MLVIDKDGVKDFVSLEILLYGRILIIALKKVEVIVSLWKVGGKIEVVDLYGKDSDF